MLRPWDLKIVIRRGSHTAVYLQITHAIIEEIRRGRLAPGGALPGSREMAEALEVNRKTVVLAYEELTAQGWLAPERKRGTFVSSELPTQQPVPMGRLDYGGDIKMPRRPDFALRGTAPNIPVLVPGEGMLTFDDGAPDTRLAPVEILARAYRNALTALARRNRLGYGDPRGTPVLRRAVSTMLNLDRGLTTTPDNICILRGSQMGIFLAARILAGRGDTAAVEALSYLPAREAFRAAGAEVVPVGLDAQGMRVDDLELLCRKRPIRAVYVTPHHQFPTTVLMRPDRRLRLLALAEQFGFAIVEDDYDHEFHFTHQPMLPLASSDRWGKVVYIGSLSKLLTPSLRLGYVAAPVPVIERIAAEIMLIDRQGDPATETAVAALMESGEIRRHTRKVLKIYAERRQMLAGQLREQLGSAVDFALPEGGLALWLAFREPIDLDALAAAAKREGVAFLPSRAFTDAGEPVAGMRLGFASLNPREMAEAVRRLSRALKLPPG